MTDRTSLKRWICVASALALLVAVITSPLRALSSSGALARSDGFRRNLAIPPTRSASFALKSVTLRTAPVKAVRSETEEEKLSRAACPARYSLGPPAASPLRSPARTPAGFGPPRTSQPLRC